MQHCVVAAICASIILSLGSCSQSTPPTANSAAAETLSVPPNISQNQLAKLSEETEGKIKDGTYLRGVKIDVVRRGDDIFWSYQDASGTHTVKPGEKMIYDLGPNFAKQITVGGEKIWQYRDMRGVERKMVKQPDRYIILIGLSQKHKKCVD
jgi:hypothetical protein